MSQKSNSAGKKLLNDGFQFFVQSSSCGKSYTENYSSSLVNFGPCAPCSGSVCTPHNRGLVVWGVCLMTFCPKMHQKRFQGVLKYGKGHKIGLKVRYMTSINIVALQKKVFPYEMELFGSLLSPIHKIYLSKVYFHHTRCPKKWKIWWNGLKIEI